MSRAVSELKQIPFSQLIGGPLSAAVEAQAMAAQSSIEFIQKIGFKSAASDEFPDSLLFKDITKDAEAGELRYVTFKYSKTPKATGAPDAPLPDEEFRLEVPLLAITPIPYIRIEEITIDFKAKLTDMVVRNTSKSFDSSISGKGSYGAFYTPYRAEMRASATFKSSSSSQAQSQREYTLDIHVRAVQDAMPAGLSKILDILENAIKDKPVA